MKINPNAVLLNHKGEPLKEGEKDVTLGDVLTAALLASFPREETRNVRLGHGDRFRLAQRIVQAEGEVEVKVEEAADLKALVNIGFGPLVVGPVEALLEG